MTFEVTLILLCLISFLICSKLIQKFQILPQKHLVCCSDSQTTMNPIQCRSKKYIKEKDYAHNETKLTQTQLITNQKVFLKKENEWPENIYFVWKEKNDHLPKKEVKE